MGNGFASRIRKWYTAIYEFVTEKGIEAHEETKASRTQRIAHFWLLVFKSFGRNRCPLRATALGYTTLLALIPLLAVSFAILSSYLKETSPTTTRELITQFIDAVVPQLKLIPEEPGKPAARVEAIERIEELINKANSKTLGFTGSLGVITVAILLFSTIEGTFNDIWGVTRGRTWWRRLVQYWVMITFGPIAMSTVIYLVSTTYFKSGQELLETLPFVGKVVPFVALRVMTLLAQRFEFGGKPPTVFEIATELEVPSRLIGRVVQPLIDAGLVLEVACESNEFGYAPARPIERITCYDVLQTLRAGGGQELETRDEQTRAVVCAHFEGIEAAERQAAASRSLKDLVNEVQLSGSQSRSGLVSLHK